MSIIDTIKTTLEERENNYNKPSKSFEGIALFWRDYIYHKYNIIVPLDSIDVSQMMVLLKVTRFSQNPNLDNIDCLTDQVGYPICTESILNEEPKLILDELLLELKRRNKEI